MADIVIRAGCFICIIILGILLRRVGVFQEKDFGVISNIVLKITLPAAIIISFNDKEIPLNLLFIILLGLLCGLIYIALGFISNLKSSRSRRAFDVLNYPGYNIGNFTLPFVQSFLGPMGVVITSLFDVGNAMICLGGAYGTACLVKEGSGFSFKSICSKLFRSVPFVCYIIMLVLCLFKLQLPSPVASFVRIIANAAPFMAMLMIGVGFKLEVDRTSIKYIVKYILIRYALSVVFALVFYYLLPFSMEIRKTLVILVFSPFCTSAPAFTSALNEDVGLSSAINSLSIVISVIIIVSILIFLP